MPQIHSSTSFFCFKCKQKKPKEMKHYVYRVKVEKESDLGSIQEWSQGYIVCEECSRKLDNKVGRNLRRNAEFIIET